MRYDIYVQKGMTEDQTPLTSESPQTDVSVSPKKAIGLSIGINQIMANANTAAATIAQEMSSSGYERGALAIQNTQTVATMIATKIFLPKLSYINIISGAAGAVTGYRDRLRQNRNIDFQSRIKGPRIDRHQRGTSIYD